MAFSFRILMNFPLKKDKSTRNFYYIMGGILIAQTFLILLFDSSAFMLILGLNLLSALLPYIAYKSSKISIQGNQLIAKVYWISKKIDIEKIRYVEFNHSWSYSGSSIKVAISKNNLILHYEKYEELLVGPADELTFINELRKINPEIYTKGEPK